MAKISLSKLRSVKLFFIIVLKYYFGEYVECYRNWTLEMLQTQVRTDDNQSINNCQTPIKSSSDAPVSV